ncbi:MAG: hypothetical protein U9Q38_01265 [Thermodesulfobacteriota bacterium]|nr:hypothetical protein [Thermodesulfobacteriota bacterium]
MTELDEQITSLNADIEEQKILYPVFKDLLKKALHKAPEGLPFLEKVKLKRDKTDKIALIFQELAKKSNLKIEEVVTDVDSLIDDSGFLMLNVAVKGDMFDLRNFMVKLGEVQYIEHIERIQIKTVDKSKEMRLKLWIARE